MIFSKKLAVVAISMLAPSVVLAANLELNNKYAEGQSSPYYQGTITPEVASTSTSTVQKYVGVKAGMQMTEKHKAPELDAAIQAGVYGGLTFKNNFGVEVEYSMTNETDVVSKLNGQGKYQTLNYNGFVTYKHPVSDAVYLKTKVGLSGTELTQTYQKVKKQTNDIGVAGGVRVGYDVNKNIAVEGDYSLYNSKKIGMHALTLGAAVKF